MILSNYNGVGGRQADCGKLAQGNIGASELIWLRVGYRHLRPVEVHDEPYVWEAYVHPAPFDSQLNHNVRGRATSAAPM